MLEVAKISWDNQQQTSCEDNYNKLYLYSLTLTNGMSMTFSHGVWMFRVWDLGFMVRLISWLVGWLAGWLALSTHTCCNFTCTYILLLVLFLVAVWCCLSACVNAAETEIQVHAYCMCQTKKIFDANDTLQIK